MTPHEVVKENIINAQKKVDSLLETHVIKLIDKNVIKDIRVIPNVLSQDITHIFKEIQLSLLLSVKEMAEQQKQINEINGSKEFSQHSEGFGYNQALEDIQSLLDIEINKIKEI